MFLEYVVFHEMCHLVYHPGAAGEDGHEDVDHNPRFQSLEKRYPYYRQAIEFDSTELPAIVEKWRNYRESKNK
jgi:predicted metal-dependent hydrolase